MTGCVGFRPSPLLVPRDLAGDSLVRSGLAWPGPPSTCTDPDNSGYMDEEGFLFGSDMTTSRIIALFEGWRGGKTMRDVKKPEKAIAEDERLAKEIQLAY